MVLKVLSQSKFLSANITREFALSVVGNEVPPKAVFVGVCPVAVFKCALESVLRHYIVVGRFLKLRLCVHSVSLLGHLVVFYRYNPEFIDENKELSLNLKCDQDYNLMIIDGIDFLSER